MVGRHFHAIGPFQIVGVGAHALLDRKRQRTLLVAEAEAEVKREVGANFEEV